MIVLCKNPPKSTKTKRKLKCYHYKVTRIFQVNLEVYVCNSQKKFLKILFIYLFILERGEGRERGAEKR